VDSSNRIEGCNFIEEFSIQVCSFRFSNFWDGR